MPTALHWKTFKALSFSSQAAGLTYHVRILLLLRQCPQCTSDTVDSWQAQKHQDKIWKQTWGCVMNDFYPGLILAHHIPIHVLEDSQQLQSFRSVLQGFFLSPISTDSVSYAAKIRARQREGEEQYGE